MPDFERRNDFAAGTVDGASFEARPDAVVPLVANAPGPLAIGDTSAGQLRKGWYARLAANGSSVFLGESNDDGSSWKAEVPLLTVDGEGTTLSLAFDASGRPIVAVEVGSEVWLYEWTGAAYERTEVLAGTASPALVLRSPNGAFAEPFLFYERDGHVYFRAQSEAWATEHGPAHQLVPGQRLWRAILGSEDRIHLIFSTRNEGAGTYSLQRRTSGPFSAGCLETFGHSERIDDGVESLVVWRGDGEIRTSCIVACDVLIIAAGGNAGDAGSGERSVLWMDESGLGLDPDSDPVPEVHHAYGGGHGRAQDQNGFGGGSGGGGGGASPSNNSMWTAGGGAVAGQGHPGGGGRSSWGLLARKVAGSGGGGGYGGPGGGGAGGNPGEPGPGGAIPGWNWSGPRGGRGFEVVVVGSSTGGVHGGGGAGGVISRAGAIIPAGQTIRVEVGQGASGGGAGSGGDAQGGPGITGMVVLRLRRLGLEELPFGALSGGDEAVDGPWTYHTFLADGEIEVTTPGRVEIVAVGGGGGGGSDAGGGGGGGDVRIVQAYLSENEDVVVGAGGAAGVAGGDGEDGGDSSVGAHVTAQGGGGGAGAPPTGLAGSRATGGGGHGDGGEAGGGRALRGYAGGPGGGFALSAGGESYHAGGGGGAGGDGQPGALRENVGDALGDAWYMPTGFTHVVLDQRIQRGSAANTWRAMLHKDVSANKMLVQGIVSPGTNQTRIGVAVLANYPTAPGDDPDEVPVAYFGEVSRHYNRFMLIDSAIGMSDILGQQVTVEVWAEDDLQQGLAQSINAPTRRQTTKSDLNGVYGSFGWALVHDPLSNQGFGNSYQIAGFRDRFLYVEGVPTGGKAQVLREDGTVVNEATETAGDAAIDLSMYGDGTTGVERVPFNGWNGIRVLDDEDAVVAEIVGVEVYPGGEYEVVAGEIDVKLDPGDSSSEPAPITGLLAKSRWDELTPGPLHGDGGPGIPEAAEPEDWEDDPSVRLGIRDPSWRLIAGVPEVMGGGGGAGAEIFARGAGGIGGGGRGGIGSPPIALWEAEDGVDGTGGGGGGSGDDTADAGKGGSGRVVFRTFDPNWEPPPVPDAFAWFAAEDLPALYADGAPVTTWPDRSPNGYDVTIGAGSPVLDEDGGPGGVHPAVVYNGSSHHARASTPRAGDGESITMYAVYFWSGSGNTSVLSMRVSSSEFIETHTPWSGQLYFDHGVSSSGGRINGAMPSGFAGSWHVIEWHKPNLVDPATISVDGVVAVSGVMTSALTRLSDTLRLMGGTAASTNGRLAEGIIFPEALTDEQRNAVRAQLATKYGISVAAL